MSGRYARWLAGLGAVLGVAGLLLQLVILLRNMTANGESAAAALWRFFGFFTILTNILVTAILARAAWRPDDRRGLNAPSMEAVGATGILLVAIVYHTMLAPLWDPRGGQLVADLLLHTATPIVYSLFWLARPHGALDYRDALLCLVWPLVYCVYALARGALDGWYAYPFLDPTQAPWSKIAVTCALLMAAFCIGALALIALDKLLARRALP